MKKIRIFIASPNDTEEERILFSIVIEGLQNSIGNQLKIQLEPLKWETHVSPAIGEDGQDVINNQIGEYDILVGIMWKKFGTRTKRSSSGTKEEFERAYESFKKYSRPKVMFYFKRADFYTSNLNEINQFRKVIKFKMELAKLGVLYFEYEKAIEFERRLREHLTKQLFELDRITKGIEISINKLRPKVFISYKSQDFSKVEEIYQHLQEYNINVWMDAKDILPGKHWRDEIKEALGSSDIELVCITSNLNNKNLESFTDFSVNNEVKESNCYILPVRLENVDAPDYLKKYQWIDLFDIKDISKLVSTINKIWETEFPMKK